jgi:hypothetical protein
MKVRLELTEFVNGDWKHVLFADIDTDEGQVAELLSALQASVSGDELRFNWEYAP